MALGSHGLSQESHDALHAEAKEHGPFLWLPVQVSTSPCYLQQLAPCSHHVDWPTLMSEYVSGILHYIVVSAGRQEIFASCQHGIHFHMQDSKEAGFLKVLAFWTEVICQYDARFILKADDDVYVNLEKVPMLLKQWDALEVGEAFLTLNQNLVTYLSCMIKKSYKRHSAAAEGRNMNGPWCCLGGQGSQQMSFWHVPIRTCKFQRPAAGLQTHALHSKARTAGDSEPAAYPSLVRQHLSCQSCISQQPCISSHVALPVCSRPGCCVVCIHI